MERARVLPWLRIATGSLCLVVAALLAALWIRSAFRADLLSLPLPSGRAAHFSSTNGQLILVAAPARPTTKYGLQNESLRTLKVDFVKRINIVNRSASRLRAQAESKLRLMQFQTKQLDQTTYEEAVLQEEMATLEAQKADLHALTQAAGHGDGWMLTMFALQLPQSDVEQQHTNYLGFGGQWANRRFAVELPHWFLISLFVAIAVVTLLKLRPRFKLRTLLAATTLLAIALGLSVARNG